MTRATGRDGIGVGVGPTSPLGYPVGPAFDLAARSAGEPGHTERDHHGAAR